MLILSSLDFNGIILYLLTNTIYIVLYFIFLGGMSSKLSNDYTTLLDEIESDEEGNNFL